MREVNKVMSSKKLIKKIKKTFVCFSNTIYSLVTGYTITMTKCLVLFLIKIVSRIDTCENSAQSDRRANSEKTQLIKFLFSKFLILIKISI